MDTREKIDEDEKQAADFGVRTDSIETRHGRLLEEAGPVRRVGRVPRPSCRGLLLIASTDSDLIVFAKGYLG